MPGKREVAVGSVKIGGGAPVRIQSMTTTKTEDVEATASQIRALEQAGCEIVRVSVTSEKSAEAIRKIKAQASVPIVADIHFDYRFALLAAENGADKLRINPGNIGGEENVRILSDCAKAHGLPIRIGVNAGSLERELLAQYGRPAPEALVESVRRHARLLEKNGFYDIVLSIKASNAKDTVEACRMLHAAFPYPLHIGVTEAGFGERAVIKSAVGLGALLLDGIGDTLRVSITGDPVREIRAAKEILQAAGLRGEGVEIISCPTCGRCNVPLEDLARQVSARLAHIQKPLKVAVMGCAVNGPGEAREADIGVAFGEGKGILFKKGEKIAYGSTEKIIGLLVQEAIAMVV